MACSIGATAVRAAAAHAPCVAPVRLAWRGKATSTSAGAAQNMQEACGGAAPRVLEHLVPRPAPVLPIETTSALDATQGVVDMRERHFLSLKDFSAVEIQQLLATAASLKRWYRAGQRLSNEAAAFQPLLGETIAMIFQKSSTRTRVSTETGMQKLGGSALFLSNRDIQLGSSESLEDTARVLSRFNSIILARVFDHQDVVTLAENSAVPVINALSDTYHPLQTLADLLTLQESFGRQMLTGRTLAWVGDGNNVLHSLMLGCPALGMNVRVATPTGYEAFPEVTELANNAAEANGVDRVFTTTDPLEAVHGADVIVTDTWISMGQEEEYERRLKDFAGYQVTMDMAKNGGAKRGWRFLHCLPRYPYEVDDEVFSHPTRSLVWEAAENRMWTVMSVMLHQLRSQDRFFDPFQPQP